MLLIPRTSNWTNATFGEELTSATDHFEVVAAKIAACWQDGPEMRSQVIDDLELAAIRLRTAFLALPREVVLP